MRWSNSLRSSGTWYLTALAIGVVLERFANYLWYEQPILWGQPANILVSFGFFAVAFVMWLILSRRQRATGWLLVFLTAMGIAWLAHWMLYRYHGDAMNYTAILYVPMLALLGIKPPTATEARTAILGFAWTVASVLTITRLLEMLGLLDIKEQAEYVIEFDTANYFLPLNDPLGIEGRWPGPFGHNGDTAMMAALIIVIAFAYWTKASWFFLFVGGFTLLLTNGRASLGAIVAGLVLLAMFTDRGHLGRFPRVWRLGIGGALLMMGALALYLRPAGLTGRSAFWPAFLDLWQTSPIVGVGSSGIAVSGGLTQEFGHAHSLYIDELARYGLVGFVVQFTAIGVGVFIAARAAGVRYPGPIAVITTYLVTGITEPRNNWIAPSATGFLLILAVAAAAGYMSQCKAGRSPRLDHKPLDESDLANTRSADASPGDAQSRKLG